MKYLFIILFLILNVNVYSQENDIENSQSVLQKTIKNDPTKIKYTLRGHAVLGRVRIFSINKIFENYEVGLWFRESEIGYFNDEYKNILTNVFLEQISKLDLNILLNGFGGNITFDSKGLIKIENKYDNLIQNQINISLKNLNNLLTKIKDESFKNKSLDYHLFVDEIIENKENE